MMNRISHSSRWLGIFFLFYGILFLAILIQTILNFNLEFNFDFEIFNSFPLIGLSILSLNLIGKFVMLVAVIGLITSGIALIKQKAWSKKFSIGFCSLMVLFWLYLVRGVMTSLQTGHQTSASLTSCMSVPFFPFIFILIFLLWPANKK